MLFKVFSQSIEVFIVDIKTEKSLVIDELLINEEAAQTPCFRFPISRTMFLNLMQYCWTQFYKKKKKMLDAKLAS